MKTSLIMLGLVFLSAAVNTWANADDKSTDQDKLQGNWSLVSVTRGGKAAPEDAIKSAVMTIAGDKLTMKNGDRTMNMKFKLSPAKSPKEMDVDMDGQTGLGLYELDGDSLKVIHGEIGDPRPTDFVSKDGSRLTLMVLKREQK